MNRFKGRTQIQSQDNTTYQITRTYRMGSWSRTRKDAESASSILLTVFSLPLKLVSGVKIESCSTKMVLVHPKAGGHKIKILSSQTRSTLTLSTILFPQSTCTRLLILFFICDLGVYVWLWRYKANQSSRKEVCEIVAVIFVETSKDGFFLFVIILRYINQREVK